ncbi:MAG: CBS domain-containing protein [Candidatus Hodarchaeota archaeon]
MHQIPSPIELRQMRKKANLTQVELAKRSKVSQSLIARVEKGDVNPSINTLRKILDALKPPTIFQATAKDIVQWKIKNKNITKIISLSPNKTVREAATLMQKYDVSQLPVVEGNVLVGSIQESTIVKWLLKVSDPIHIFDKKVSEIMEERFPIVSLDTDVNQLFRIIGSGYPAVLIMSQGKFKGLISKIDLVGFSGQHRSQQQP